MGTPVKQINPFYRRPRGSWSVASASKRFNLAFRRWEQFSNVVVFLSPSLPSPREYPLYDSLAVAVLSSGISSLVRERKRDRRRELISTRISVFLSRTSQHVDNEHPYIREHIGGIETRPRSDNENPSDPVIIWHCTLAELTALTIVLDVVNFRSWLPTTWLNVYGKEILFGLQEFWKYAEMPEVLRRKKKKKENQGWFKIYYSSLKEVRLSF